MPLPTLSDEAELVTDLPAYTAPIHCDIEALMIADVLLQMRANPPHHKANETPDLNGLALSGCGDLVSHEVNNDA